MSNFGTHTGANLFMMQVGRVLKVKKKVFGDSPKNDSLEKQIWSSVPGLINPGTSLTHLKSSARCILSINLVDGGKEDRGRC
jgi:hypothetical protein